MISNAAVTCPCRLLSVADRSGARPARRMRLKVTSAVSPAVRRLWDGVPLVGAKPRPSSAP